MREKTGFLKLKGSEPFFFFSLPRTSGIGFCLHHLPEPCFPFIPAYLPSLTSCKTQLHTPAGSGLHSISSLPRSLPPCPRTGLGNFLWASHHHPISFHNAVFSSLCYNCLPPLDDKLSVVRAQALFLSTTNEAHGIWALPTSSLEELLTNLSSPSIESSHHFVQHSLCVRQILTTVCAITNSILHQPSERDYADACTSEDVEVRRW